MGYSDLTFAGFVPAPSGDGYSSFVVCQLL